MLYKYSFSFLIFILTQCASVSNKKIENNNLLASEKVIKTCPNEGSCNLIIHNNAEIITDKYGGFIIEKNKKNTVIEFSYSKNMDQMATDGHYSEYVVFEILNNDLNLLLENNKLQDVKMFYKKSCYCRGKAGTFKVFEGKLTLNQKNNNLNFELVFPENGNQLVKKITVKNNQLN